MGHGKTTGTNRLHLFNRDFVGNDGQLNLFPNYFGKAITKTSVKGNVCTGALILACYAEGFFDDEVVHDGEIAQSSGAPVNYGTVTLEADNAVVWIRNNGTPGSLGGLVSTNDQPIEMYLDGNIVFYQGQRVIYADRMYYNVSSEYGMVLAAEVITPVPQYQGLLRLKADVLQQRDRQNFMAYGAAFTSSRLGVPRYWMQAGEVKLQDQRTEADMSALPSPDSTHPTHMRATANSNFVYLGGLPIAYWPTFSSNLSKPSFYLTSLKFKNDQIFGTQIYSDFDAYQLLGIDGFEGTSHIAGQFM